MLNRIGAAFDVGWQWQISNFIVGGSLGVQYTKVSKEIPLGGDGGPADEFFSPVVIESDVRSGLRPRLAINLGYAF